MIKIHKSSFNITTSNRRAEDGDFDYTTNKPKETRGRGTRGRARGGRGGRGRGGHDGEHRPRGERGFGRGRGRGRGGYNKDYAGPRDTYSKFATRENVKDEAGATEEQTQEEGHYDQKRYYDIERSGTGHGKEVKKGGAGKGGWGNPDQDKKLEHMGAEDAAEAVTEVVEDDQKHYEKDQKHHEEEQKEEEEVNNLTYSEYIAQKKSEGSTLKKGKARKPEEIKVSNIQKYEKTNTGVKQVKSNIKSHEAYAMSGVSGDIEVGFQAIGDEPEESFERRGRGRGRGGYRGHQRDNEGPHKPSRGGRKKFVANDDEFPAL